MVNAETQLNANFQELENKLAPFQDNPNTIVAPPIGIEAFSSNEIAVWNGTQWCNNLSHDTWGAWQSFSLRAPVTARNTQTPAARVNSWQRRVIFTGGLDYNAGAAWPTGSDIEITTDTSISADLAPVPGGLTYFQAATSQVTGVNQLATANIRVQHILGPPERVAIYVRFQGDSGGGNFVQLDGLEWWY